MLLGGIACVCLYICVKDFWPLKTRCVLSSSTVSILSDPLGGSTHIQHPSPSATFLHARLAPAPSFCLCFSLFHIASLSLLPPPPFSFQLQTEGADLYSKTRGLPQKRTHTYMKYADFRPARSFPPSKATVCYGVRQFSSLLK